MRGEAAVLTRCPPRFSRQWPSPHLALPRRRAAHKLLRAPTEAEIAEVSRKLDTISGCRGEGLRFAVAFHYATGVRVKELRLAALRDLDLRAMRFVVEHPKGEGVWADAGETVALPPSLRVVVEDFLDARARRCRSMDLEPDRVEPPIPAWRGLYYSEAGWRGVRVKAYREAAIVGNFRELRPAHAMRLKKLGVPIEAVSRCLRNANTVTTEAFYARIADEDAQEACVRAWESAAILPN